MSAVRTVAVRLLRQRGRALIGLAALVGVAGGLVIAAAAGARRTDTALDRFLTFSREPDVGANVPLSLADTIEQLPVVEAAARQTYVPLGFPDLPEDEWDNIVPFVSLDGRYGRTVARPLVLSGRPPDPSRVDEIAVSAALAEKRRVSQGSVLRAKTFTAADLMGAEETGAFVPTGPEVVLRVTGVVRLPADLAKTDDESDFISGEEMMYLTPAFWRRHVSVLPRFGEQAAILVRLSNGARDAEAFRIGAERANGGPFDGEDFGVYEFGQETAKADRALRVQAVTVYLFALLAAVATLFVIGQAVARQLYVESLDNSVLRGLGMSPRQLVAAALLRMAAVAAGASVVAAAVAVALSSRFPFGLARTAEPDPGTELNVALVFGGVAVLVLSVLALASWPAWRTAHSAGARDASARPSLAAETAARVGLPAAAVTGVRMALDPGRGAAAIPVRVSLVGATVGVAAVAAALTFGASLSRLADTPSLQGTTWDTIVEAEGDDVRERLAEEAVVSRVAAGATTNARLGNDALVVVGLERQARELWPPLTRGRYPARPGEIVIGSRGADRLGLVVGRTVTIEGVDGELVARVVGIVVFPDILLADRTGEGAVAPLEDIERLDPQAAELPNYYVKFKSSVDPAQAARAVEQEFGGSLRPYQPADVRNVVRISGMPYALAGLLGALGLATLTHTLVSAVRRRRRDLALLKTIGFSRSQVAATIAWQTTTVVAVGLFVGLPVGVAAGRWAWLVVADQIDVVPRATVPYVAVLLSIPVALILANLVGALPAAAAARTRPAVALRSE